MFVLDEPKKAPKKNLRGFVIPIGLAKRKRRNIDAKSCNPSPIIANIFESGN